MPFADLPRVYGAADVLLYAPLYAGFGLPPLEAMACGVPVIIREVGTLPEMQHLSPRAFLALAKEEDFGMTVVEAQAAGRPVIAFRGGGYLETVIEGKTGVFFDELTVENLADAVRRLEKTKWNKKEIQENAKRFSKEKFIEGVEKLVPPRSLLGGTKR